MESPDWSDQYTPDELVAALRMHGNRLAKMTGWYEIAQEILQAASCIEDLAEQRDQLRRAGGDVMRKLMASRESLSKLPPC